MRCHSSSDLCVLGWPWARVVRPRCARFSVQSTKIYHAKSFIGSLPPTKTIISLYCLYHASYNILFILSNLDTHIQFTVVLLDKIPLHVSGWLAHHQEVHTCTVHAANCSSLSSMLSSRPLGMDCRPSPTVATSAY